VVFTQIDYKDMDEPAFTAKQVAQLDAEVEGELLNRDS
jgi:hypothetical protein